MNRIYWLTKSIKVGRTYDGDRGEGTHYWIEIGQYGFQVTFY